MHAFELHDGNLFSTEGPRGCRGLDETKRSKMHLAGLAVPAGAASGLAATERLPDRFTDLGGGRRIRGAQQQVDHRVGVVEPWEVPAAAQPDPAGLVGQLPAVP